MPEPYDLWKDTLRLSAENAALRKENATLSRVKGELDEALTNEKARRLNLSTENADLRSMRTQDHKRIIAQRKAISDYAQWIKELEQEVLDMLSCWC